MDSNITIRLPEAQRRALKNRSRQLNVSESQMIRDLIERELSESSMETRLEGIIGAVSLAAEEQGSYSSSKSLSEIRERNWRPAE